MPLKLTLEIGDSDLDRYREIMRGAGRRAASRPEKDLIEAARELLQKVRHSQPAEFVRKRLGSLESLIAMLEDTEWALEGEDRERVVTGMAYFADPADLIPDHVPGLGLVDDAIMVELIVRELKHEVEAYQDFCRYREAQAQRRGQESPATREQWLAAKRRQMVQRIRRRREESRFRHRYRAPAPLIVSYRNLER